VCNRSVSSNRSVSNGHIVSKVSSGLSEKKNCAFSLEKGLFIKLCTSPFYLYLNT